MQCVCPKSGRRIFLKCWRLVWKHYLLLFFLVPLVVWKWHTLPLRVYWAHSWRKAEGSSPDEFWQPCWTTLTVQPSHAWPGNEKQVHRWKKRIYRGAPKKRRPQPYFSFALSPTYTQSLSLWNTAVWNHLSYILCLSRWADMQPENTEWCPIFWSYFIRSYWTSHQKRRTSCLLLPSSLYLLWVYYFLFDSCHMFSDFDCLRHSRTSEFKWSVLNQHFL